MNTRLGESAVRGRPRSESARDAVLHAADDLLVELGYEALTMKGIAERAGVGRQTVYRWWASKAEILFEACALDVRRELAIGTGSPADILAAYIESLLVFLNDSDAGATYLALLGASRVDRAVAELLSAADPLRESASGLIDALALAPDAPDRELAIALVTGPMVFQALSVPGAISPGFAEGHRQSVEHALKISRKSAENGPHRKLAEK